MIRPRFKASQIMTYKIFVTTTKDIRRFPKFHKNALKELKCKYSKGYCEQKITLSENIGKISRHYWILFVRIYIVLCPACMYFRALIYLRPRAVLKTKGTVFPNTDLPAGK